MVEQRQAQRRGRILGGVRPTGEEHRVTPFELFFDLVYVFAATQVTGSMGTSRSLLASCSPPWAWRGVLAHADESEPLGGFYAAALFGGVALYLAGYLLFKRRLHGALSLPRLVAIGVLLAACPPPSSSHRWSGWPAWCS